MSTHWKVQNVPRKLASPTLVYKSAEVEVGEVEVCMQTVQYTPPVSGLGGGSCSSPRFNNIRAATMTLKNIHKVVSLC